MSTNAAPNLAGGGEPPYDKCVETRLTVLETRFDTILPTLATKSDIEAVRLEMEKLRTEIFKALNDTVWPLIGVIVTLFVGTWGVNIALYNSLKSLIVFTQPVAASVRQRHLPVQPPIVVPQEQPKVP
jgi:hypothetical protein